MEYFERLFKGSKHYLSSQGRLLLVLSDECNLILINEIATKEGYAHQIIYNRVNFIEKTFIIQYNFQG